MRLSTYFSNAEACDTLLGCAMARVCDERLFLPGNRGKSLSNCSMQHRAIHGRSLDQNDHDVKKANEHEVVKMTSDKQNSGRNGVGYSEKRSQ